MATFSGTDLLTMDAKGRLAIPARYRAPLSEHCASRLKVTASARPTDGFLMLYPLPAWEVVQQTLLDLPSNPGSEYLRRRIVGYAKDIELDKQGRMLLPPELRSEAKLDREIALVGQINKFQIWSGDAWRDACSPERAAEVDLDSVLATVSL